MLLTGLLGCPVKRTRVDGLVVVVVVKHPIEHHAFIRHGTVRGDGSVEILAEVVGVEIGVCVHSCIHGVAATTAGLVAATAAVVVDPEAVAVRVQHLNAHRGVVVPRILNVEGIVAN